MKKARLLTFTLLITGAAISQNNSLAVQTAHTIMNIWKDSFAVQPGKPVKWTYDQAVVLQGIEGLWKNTGDGKYFAYIQKSMDFFVDDKGDIKTYKAGDYTLDNIAPGRILLLLYNVTGKEKYLKAVNTLHKQLHSQPRNSEGGFWHKQIYPSQMWLDGLYMAEPFYTEFANTFHEQGAYHDIATQFILMEKSARDAKTGLLYHGYDESRKEKWADKTTGLSPNFWGRAMGWYGMGLVDVLEKFPDNDADKKILVDIFQRFASAVSKVQDAKSGLWWDILNAPGRDRNYLETSATSMFVYTLAKGVRLGYLPQSYRSVARKGYEGLVNNFVKAENGQINLYGTVSVSGLGGNPYRDGSYDYYVGEKVAVNDPKGLGAFLQAANEMDIAQTLAYGKGKTVVLDNYFNHETKKDITGTTISFHYVWDELDNNGYSLFGHVFNRYGVQTNTLTVAPTLQNLKGADMYIIVDPDNAKESAHPNYIEQPQINAIYKWVEEGGVLLLFGNDSANVELPHFNELAKRFGFQFNYDVQHPVTGNQYEMGAFNIPPGHPIFKTARKIYIKEYASQTVTGPAHAVFMDGKMVAMSVAKVGRGTVFAVGDPWFYNEYFDGRKLPSDFENYKAAEDLVRWAIDQSNQKGK